MEPNSDLASDSYSDAYTYLTGNPFTGKVADARPAGNLGTSRIIERRWAVATERQALCKAFAGRFGCALRSLVWQLVTPGGTADLGPDAPLRGQPPRSASCWCRPRTLLAPPLFLLRARPRPVMSSRRIRLSTNGLAGQAVTPPVCPANARPDAAASRRLPVTARCEAPEADREWLAIVIGLTGRTAPTRCFEGL